MLFAGAGYEVFLYDVEESQLNNAQKDIREQLTKLEESGLLRGSLNAKEQMDLINFSQDLAKCLRGAKHLQVLLSGTL